MFTLSVVLGSSILYKDFNSATLERVLKFSFGCFSTFIGVYLITSKRPTVHPKTPRKQTSQLLPTAQETTPLIVVPIETSTSDGLAETPPHLLGTQFGYHFTNPRILELRGARSTLPRGNRPRDDLASAIWSSWRTPDSAGRSERMARTQSERGDVMGAMVADADWGRDGQSDVGVRPNEPNGPVELGRNRGNSAV